MTKEYVLGAAIIGILGAVAYRTLSYQIFPKAHVTANEMEHI